MYWRRGVGRTLLWVAALTAALCALAAHMKAGSPTAAQALALLALVLSPVTHEAIARVRHVRAPAKITYFAVILLVPLAFGALAIEGMATFEAEARRLGYASGADRQRARDLKLATADALAAYDQERRAKFCRDLGAQRPIECFEPGHRAAARAFTRSRFDDADLEPSIKAALAEQRTRLLAVEPSCKVLLDRIEEDAPEAMTTDAAKALDIQAAIWATRLTERELALMVERAKPGVAHLATPESRAIEAKIAAEAADVQKLYSERLQAWSRDVVFKGIGWRQMLRGPPPVGDCRIAAGVVPR